ncbi:MAG TPA: hypothetical protein VLD15_08155 [Burkholderiales bacterium]|nr:hypothetical protein [Burkholderiales bacterium]
MPAVVLIVIGLIAGVLGYGYWHSARHATLTVVLTDSSKKERDGRVLNAELVFLDTSSRPVARGRTDGKHGIVLLRHPVSGYCGKDLTPESYRACVVGQPEWLAGWVGKLRYISVVLGDCRIERVPVEVTVNHDSLLAWWVPLREGSGVPYRRYAARLEVDARVCAVTSYRG